ncbi:ABC transporter G family member 32 [Tanacetum coccineum]
MQWELKLPLHSCSLPGSMNATQVSFWEALLHFREVGEQNCKFGNHRFTGLCGVAKVLDLNTPAPETYDLFDDIILICEGHIVYQGPRNVALDFFAFMRFQCPQRKNVADFIQEVVSEKDQEQYCIPTSLIESGIWVIVTYYVVELDPNFVRFLKQILLYFFLHQMSISLFRLMGSLGLFFCDVNCYGSWWIRDIKSLGALLGYTILFNGLFTIFLSYLNPLGGSQTVVSDERKDKDGKKNGESVVIQLREFLEHSGSFTGNNIHQGGMVLPFQPLSMAFSNINYYVDVPPNVLVSILSNYMVDTDWLLSALLVALVAHIEGIVQTVTLQVNASVDCLGGLRAMVLHW